MGERVGTLLDRIDNGSVMLPEFQRGYVWNRDQVRNFMRSLYRRYPVGSLLVWQTKSEAAPVRGNDPPQLGYVDLLLDGQQRVTTLYGIIRGTPPPFFEGDPEAFKGLHFHVEEETFEFYAPVKMKNEPRWVDVTSLMTQGVTPALKLLSSNGADELVRYVEKLTRLSDIKEMEFHVEQITGEDKTIDVVVEIFDLVNSGGTKLSKADLALSKLCAESPALRSRMRASLKRWSQAGFEFRLEWLLRVATAVLSGESRFETLDRVTPKDFADALTKGEAAVNTLLNNIAARLGLDHDRVISGRFAFAVMARHLVNRGGKCTDDAELRKLLYWYVQSFLWARYVGPTETILNQDLAAVDRDGVDGLLVLLRTWRSDLEVRPSDFEGYSMGARFYPLLYLLTRGREARDWWNGAPPLSAHLLGKQSKLQVHHIFPKALLYAHGYERAEVNAIANFCFLTMGTNLWVGARNPEEYFEVVERHYPGALASQWIPMDPSLWKVARYREFLAARRELLAQAANEFLHGLLSGPGPAARPIDVFQASVVTEMESDEERSELEQLASWAVEQGLSKPERDLEISDPESGETIAVAELAWPEGLQVGLGDPVVLDLELTHDGEARLAELGYRAFSDPAHLRRFIENYLETIANPVGLA